MAMRFKMRQVLALVILLSLGVLLGSARENTVQPPAASQSEDPDMLSFGALVTLSLLGYRPPAPAARSPRVSTNPISQPLAVM
jgi:hypothetical protein